MTINKLFRGIIMCRLPPKELPPRASPTLQVQKLNLNHHFKPGSFDVIFQISIQEQISFKSGTHILHLAAFNATSPVLWRIWEITWFSPRAIQSIGCDVSGKLCYCMQLFVFVFANLVDLNALGPHPPSPLQLLPSFNRFLLFSSVLICFHPFSLVSAIIPVCRVLGKKDWKSKLLEALGFTTFSI